MGGKMSQNNNALKNNNILIPTKEEDSDETNPLEESDISYHSELENVPLLKPPEMRESDHIALIDRQHNYFRQKQK